ncbi:hypothetical protein [Thalassoroseus pseudoceratinae]|uniref:hypothetical protein n=1 Tax=Thalassoroseus pseudoceratinae TaxID=2713176 RepID=UPI001421ABFD|nr:hypothetical protein [Thalassoroseus pseudoceratinae]
MKNLVSDIRFRQALWCIALGCLCVLESPLVAETFDNGSPELPADVGNRVLVGRGSGRLARRYCIHHGAPLYQSQSESSTVIGRLSYLEAVNLAEEYPEDSNYLFDRENRERNKDWALVVEPVRRNDVRIGKYIGWIPRRYLSDHLEVEADPRTRIAKKAAIVTPQSYLKNLASGEKPRPVQPTLSIPNEPNHVEGLPEFTPLEMPLYRILFIYAEYGDWVLVGSKPDVDPLGTPDEWKKELVGWIPKERVSRWDSRECFEWDRRAYSARSKSMGTMYTSVQAAISRDPEGSLAGTAPLNRRGELQTLDAAAMRFHLLAGPEDAYRLGEQNPEKWSDSNNSLYRLGVVLDTDVERKAGDIEQTKDEVGSTEVLFVIDHTESMDFIFNPVAEIITRITDELKRQRGGGDVRMSVCYFSDHDSDPREAVDTGLLPLKSIIENDGSWGNSLAQIVRDEKTVSVVGVASNAEELVFDGIYYGIQNAAFSENARKLVFLIGDCGNRSILGSVSAEDVVAQLIPRTGSPAELHVIQLKDPNKTKLSAHGAFQRQFHEDLRELYAERLRERLKASVLESLQANNIKLTVDPFYTFSTLHVDAAFKAKDSRQANDSRAAAAQKKLSTGFRDAVVPQLEKARVQGEILRDAMRVVLAQGAKKGVDYFNADDQATKADKETLLISQALMKQILGDRGLSDYGDDPEPYLHLYAWRLNKAGKPQLRHMIYASETEIKMVIQVLKKLGSQYEAARQLDLDVIVQEILSVQEGTVGRMIQGVGTNTSPKDQARRLFEFLSFKSPAFEQILNGDANDLIDADMIAELTLKASLLQDVLDGNGSTSNDFQRRTTDSVIWERKTPVDELKSVTRGYRRFGKDQDEYFYLDFETEWP